MSWFRRIWAHIQHSRGMLPAILFGAVLLLLGLTFWAGIAVGGRGGARPFRPPALPFGRPLGGPRGDMGHGAFGSITRIEGDSITIMDPRFGQPLTISTSPNTLIERSRHERVHVGDLHVGDKITVIGSPTSGNIIQARFIGVSQEGPMNFNRFHAPPGLGPARFPAPPRGRGIQDAPGA